MGSLIDSNGIRKYFALLLCTFTLGFPFFEAWSFKTMNEVQVNGPLFQRIVKNKDRVASVAVFQLPQGGTAGLQLLRLGRGGGLVGG